MERADELRTPVEALGVTHRKFGMWAFLASEIMFFTGLIGAYIAIRVTNPWPQAGTEENPLDIPTTAVMTFILICSSYTMVKAVEAAHDREPRLLIRWLLGTILLGGTFLGMQAFEWSTLLFKEGLHPATSVQGQVFYGLTGFHGLHVTGGVVALLYVLIQAVRGPYQRDAEGVEMMGLYWHFVDVVWIFLFTILYLI